jgi:hypothetical protein
VFDEIRFIDRSDDFRHRSCTILSFTVGIPIGRCFPFAFEYKLFSRSSPGTFRFSALRTGFDVFFELFSESANRYAVCPRRSFTIQLLVAISQHLFVSTGVPAM